MIKNYPNEKWRTLKFDAEYTNQSRIEVSNYGRLRSFNKISDGNLIKGSMINGYGIIRLKLVIARDVKTQKRLDFMQQQVYMFAKKIRLMEQNNESKAVIKEAIQLLDGLKKNLSKKFSDDLRKRTVNYHSLIHRLVAEYFLKKPGAGKTIVAHLDYNKLNNHEANLMWMTPEENYLHQQNSPFVIKEKVERQTRRKEDSRATKLTVTKVMLLKKMLNQNKPLKQLVKQFKVSDTQILRIKRGENWADIQAAT